MKLPDPESEQGTSRHYLHAALLGFWQKPFAGQVPGAQLSDKWSPQKEKEWTRNTPLKHQILKDRLHCFSKAGVNCSQKGTVTMVSLNSSEAMLSNNEIHSDSRDIRATQMHFPHSTAGSQNGRFCSSGDGRPKFLPLVMVVARQDKMFSAPAEESKPHSFWQPRSSFPDRWTHFLSELIAKCLKSHRWSMKTFQLRKPHKAVFWGRTKPI